MKINPNPCPSAVQNLISNRVAIRGLLETLLLGLLLTLLCDRAFAVNQLDTSFTAQTDNAVLALAIPASPGPYSAVLIGGVFTSPRNYLALLTDSGSLNTTFNSSVNGTVDTIVVQPDGKILIGGTFTLANGSPRGRIARLNADGTLDTGFTSYPGFESTVRSIAVQPDGKVLVGGDFLTYGNISRPYVARLLTTGALDLTFSNSPSGPSGPVYAVAYNTGGLVTLGGSFTFVGGFARGRLAKLNADGSLNAFNPQQSGQDAPNDVINTVLILNGGTYVGGNFTTPKTRGAFYFDNGFISNTTFAQGGMNSAVRTMVSAGSGNPPSVNFFVGGSFTCAEGACGSQSQKIIRMQASSGTKDNTFDVGGISGTTTSIEAICVQANGKVIFGGSFSDVQGVARGNIARVLP